MNVLTEVFKDVISIIETNAPTLASMIGSWPSLAIELAVPVLCKAFGTEGQSLPSLTHAISLNEMAPKLLAAVENEHKGAWSMLMGGTQSLSSAEINVKLNWH